MNPPSDRCTSPPPTEKPGRGRPRTLDEFKRSQICGMIAGGCSLRDAAHFVRCSYPTIRRELKRDPDFKEQLRRSELYAQLSPLRAMQKAAATHWQAAAWFLERAYPERFARRAAATLGPRQARELFDAVRKIVHSEVADPLLSMRLEERLRTPFQCFLRATGQNARTSRDLREVLKFFEQKDGLKGLLSPFDFYARPAKPTGQPTPGPGPEQSSKTTAAAPANNTC
jgi:hypothetical protein